MCRIFYFHFYLPFFLLNHLDEFQSGRPRVYLICIFFCWPQARHEAIWKTKTQNLPGKLGRYLVVMSPSRAGSSWRIFSSARLGSWPFPHQLEKKISSKIRKLAFLATQIFFFLFHLHFYSISEDFCSEYWFLLLKWLIFWFRKL